MKIYQKKNVSLEDETVLVQLERRHTLKEDTDNGNSDDNRKRVRANSLDNLGESPSSTDIEAASAKKLSKLTRRPTVITESELSSSSLYKDRKAKINSDDESIEDPRPIRPHDQVEELEPRALQDPKLMPVPVPNQRPRKRSSCCWYFTIILVIFIACLAVMAGVAGIVYMEYFAIYEDKDIANANVSEKNDDPSAPKEIFQHPTQKGNFHRNEPQIPEHILKEVIENSPKLVEDYDASKKLTTSSQPGEVISQSKDQPDSNVSKKRELNKKSFVSENRNIEVSESPEIAQVSNVLRNILSRINKLNIPISDKSVKIKPNDRNQNLLDLNLNSQSIDAIIDKAGNDKIDKINEQMAVEGSIVKEKSNSKTQVSKSSEEKISKKSVKVKSNDKNQDTFGLNFNPQSMNDAMVKPTDGNIHKVNEQLMLNGMIAEESNSKAEVSDSSEEKISKNSMEVKSNDKNQDSLEINPDFQSAGNVMDKITDGLVDKANVQLKLNEIIFTEKSNSKSEELDSNEETLVPEKHFNFDEMTTHQSIESKGEGVNAGMFRNLPELHLLRDIDPLDLMENSIKHDLDENSFDHRKNAIDHGPEENTFDHKKHSIDQDTVDNSFDHRIHDTNHDPENDSFDHWKNDNKQDSEDNSFNHNNHDSEDDSFDHRKHAVAHDVEDDFSDHSKHAIAHDPKDKFLNRAKVFIVPNDKSLDDQNKESSESNSDDSSSEENSLVDDKNEDSDDSAQLVFIRPVVESKAVPIPLAFLRRIGFDIKNPNSHQPMTAEDMDIKFSLAEALKYLRSLDTENKLPVSREKTVTRKENNQEESKKVKPSPKAEQKEYLDILRKHMFEESL